MTPQRETRMFRVTRTSPCVFHDATEVTSSHQDPSAGVNEERIALPIILKNVSPKRLVFDVAPYSRLRVSTLHGHDPAGILFFLSGMPEVARL